MTDDIAAASSVSDVSWPADGYVGEPAVQAEWDRRYADQAQLWSGQPNGALVAEVAGLTPGRVLDVGCGEGADAVWLASGGWDVTALEVSGVALARAAGHARDAGVAVRWVHAGLAEAMLSPGSFDLVSAQYPALLRTPDAAAERALLAAVAPGGVLLLVHHAGMDTQQVHDSQQMHDSGFDPADYVWPPMVTALLDDDWEVELDEQRPRIAPRAGPAPTTPTIWCCARAGCAETTRSAAGPVARRRRATRREAGRRAAPAGRVAQAAVAAK